MADKIYIDSHTKDLVINGKHYRFSNEKKPKLKGHGGDLVFREVGPDYEVRIATAANYLAKNSSELTKELIIKEALRKINPWELAKLEKNISKKKKAKVEKGCVALNVGGQQIWLVD